MMSMWTAPSDRDYYGCFELDEEPVETPEPPTTDEEPLSEEECPF